MKKQKITKTKTLIKLMEETLVNVLIGSEAMNGVTYNKYKNFKKEGKMLEAIIIIELTLIIFTT